MRNTKFGQDLKLALKNKGLTAKELSEKTGISRSAISQYINGVNEPPETKKEILRKALEIKTELTANPQKNKHDVHKSERMTPEVAARLMNKSPMFVRMGLRQRAFPWGYAVEMESGRWDYWISSERFYEETRIKKEANQIK